MREWAMLVIVAAGCSTIDAAPSTRSSVVGIVTDPDGVVGDARLRFAPIAGGIGRDVVVVAASPNGKYRVDGLVPGAWSVSVSSPIHHPKASTIEVGAAETVVDVKLDPPGYRRVTGVVRDPAGAPVMNARVEVVGAATDALDDAIATTVTNANGAYQLAIESRFFVVAVRAPGQAAMERRCDRGGNSTDIENFTLARGGRIDGLVTDAASHEIPNAMIDVWMVTPLRFAEPQASTIAADAGGSFHLDGLVSSSYELWSHSGRLGSRSPTTVIVAAPESIGEITLAMTVRPRLSGTIAKGAGVAVTATSGDLTRTVMADRAGHFTFDGLPAGAYRLEAVLALGTASDEVVLGDRDVSARLTIADRASLDDASPPSSTVSDAPSPTPLEGPSTTCVAPSAECCSGCTITCHGGAKAKCQPGSCVVEYHIQSKVNQRFTHCAWQPLCTCS